MFRCRNLYIGGFEYEVFGYMVDSGEFVYGVFIVGAFECRKCLDV